MEPRFVLDEDKDIVDNCNIKVYDSSLTKDWEKLCILLNTLELQKQKAVSDKNKMIQIIKELYEEYNNYIDEYSLLKVDIIMDIANELDIDLD